MFYLSALSLVVGLISGGVGIWLFIESRQHPAFRQRGVIFSVAAVGMLIAALIVANLPLQRGASGSGVNPTPTTNTSQPGTTPEGNTPTVEVPTVTPTPTFTPTPVSPGYSFCDTAKPGQGWDNWNLVTGWKVLNGDLLYDGTGNGEKLVAPDFCQPTTPNYVVDVRMRIVAACCHFGIWVRGGASTNGETGYELSIYTTTFQNVFIVSHGGQGGAGGSYSFDNNFHVYRAEVKDNVINFVIDGAKVLSATDNTFLTPGEVSICCTDTMELEITSFKITAL